MSCTCSQITAELPGELVGLVSAAALSSHHQSQKQGRADVLLELLSFFFLFPLLELLSCGLVFSSVFREQTPALKRHDETFELLVKVVFVRSNFLKQMCEVLKGFNHFTCCLQKSGACLSFRDISLWTRLTKSCTECNQIKLLLRVAQLF